MSWAIPDMNPKGVIGQRKPRCAKCGFILGVRHSEPCSATPPKASSETRFRAEITKRDFIDLDRPNKGPLPPRAPSQYRADFLTLVD